MLTEMNSIIERKRALIVDDDPHWRLLIGRILAQKQSNMQIDYSLSAAEAMMKLATEKPYDVVISDYQFQEETSGMDLWDAYAGLGFNKPFVLTSGFLLEQKVEEGLTFIPKNELIGNLHRSLEKMSARPVPVMAESAAIEISLFEPRELVSFLIQGMMLLMIALPTAYIFTQILAHPLSAAVAPAVTASQAKEIMITKAVPVPAKPVLKADQHPVVNKKISRVDQVFSSDLQQKMKEVQKLTDKVIADSNAQ